MMRVYVFGAGASLGSQDAQEGIYQQQKAPLVDDLFDVAYADYAHKVGLSDAQLSEIRAGCEREGSVERWLTDEWNRIEHLKEETTKGAKKTLFGRVVLYIWWLFLMVSGTYKIDNGYRLFVDRLVAQDKRFGLISFNYDTLLDQAIQSTFDIHLDRWENYLAFRFLKPHGSVNWILRKREGDPSLRSDDQYGGGLLSLDYKVRYELASKRIFTEPHGLDQLMSIPPTHQDMRNEEGLMNRAQREFFFPLMLIPLTAKMYGFVRDFSERMIAEGKTLLSDAEEIFLIGYRANDDIFKDMIVDVKSGAILHVVGRGQAKEIAERVAGLVAGIKEIVAHDEGFLRFVETQM